MDHYDSQEPPLPEVMHKLIKGLTQLSQFTSEQNQNLWNLWEIEDNARVWIKKDSSNPSFVPLGELDNVLNPLLNGSLVVKSQVLLREMESKWVVEAITDVKNRCDWDCDLSEARIIESDSLKTNLSTLYLAYHPQLTGFSPREYYLRQYVHHDPISGIHLIAFHSVDSMEISYMKRSSEGTRVCGNMIGGFIIQPLNDDEKSNGADEKHEEMRGDVNLTLILNLSVGGLLGWLPKEVVPFTFLRHIQCVSGLRLHLEDLQLERKIRPHQPISWIRSSIQKRLFNNVKQPKLTPSFGEVELPSDLDEYIKHLVNAKLEDEKSSERIQRIASEPTVIKTAKSSNVKKEDRKSVEVAALTRSNFDTTNQQSQTQPKNSEKEEDNQWVSAHPELIEKAQRFSPNSSMDELPTPAQTPPQTPQKTISFKEEEKEQLVEFMKSCVPKLITSIGKRDSWKSLGTENDVALMRSSRGKFNVFAGYGIIKVPPTQVKNVILDVKRYQEWDPLLKEVRILETIGSHTMILHLLFETKRCIVRAARDVCLALHWEPMENGFVIVGKSIQHPNCPPEPGYTRSEVLESGYLIKSKSEDPMVSMVTYTSQVDLKNAPSAVVNLIAKKQPLLISSIREILTGNKLNS